MRTTRYDLQVLDGYNWDTVRRYTLYELDERDSMYALLCHTRPADKVRVRRVRVQETYDTVEMPPVAPLNQRRAAGDIDVHPGDVIVLRGKNGTVDSRLTWDGMRADWMHSP